MARYQATLAATAALSTMFWPGGASAQEQPVERPGDDIVVTARKRAESILEVPVVVAALGQAQLQAAQITEVRDLPALVPGLNVGHSLLSIGTVVSIRGIGQTTQDPGVEQSVSLNIDGMSLGNGLAFGSGMFDVGQVEVYKGPQALFYGKGSPAGVVSIRTADPTGDTEVMLRAGYDVEARNRRIEAIASGPLGDIVKLRAAGFYSKSDGYFKNRGVGQAGSGAQTIPFSRIPRSENWMIRGTALIEPASNFTARLKLSIVRDKAILAEGFQLASCPDGTGVVPGQNIPFIQGDDCKLNRTSNVVGLDPAFFPAARNGGIPFVNTKQQYATMELDYEPTPELTLSSLTSFYKLHSQSQVNSAESSFAGPPLGVRNDFRRRLFTQELRLSSDFAGPLNFTLGAYYEDGAVRSNPTIIGNARFGSAPVLQDGIHFIDQTTYSLFGQGRWKIVPDLELAVGARWTDEKRTDSPINKLNGLPTLIPNPEIHARNVAPEATLTWTPTDDLTVFGAYKKGYKSGSFSIATPAVAGLDNSFGDEKVEGGEVGVKARMFDRQLQLNLAGYFYEYEGLQVGTRTPPVNGLPRIRTVNAAGARIYGLDFDATYRPDSIEGLTLNGALLWNKAKFLEFTNAPCYGGQLISQGCNQLFNAVVANPFNPATPGAFTAQDLSSTPLIRAPVWTVNFGWNYELPIGEGLKLSVGNSNQYSTKYVKALGANRPDNDNYQRAFAKVDLNIALKDAEDRWEIALIGKNVTDKIIAGNCNISGYQQGTAISSPAGFTQRGPAGIDEVGCFPEPGREVWLRFTFRPFG